jgi:hypothetical protein
LLVAPGDVDALPMPCASRCSAIGTGLAYRRGAAERDWQSVGTVIAAELARLAASGPLHAMTESILGAGFAAALAPTATATAGASAQALQGVVSLDMLLTVLIVATLPVCVLRPWIGMLVFALIGYMNPHRLLDGFAYDMPYAKMVAVATLAGLLITRERYALPRTREVYLLAALWVMFACSTIFRRAAARGRAREAGGDLQGPGDDHRDHHALPGSPQAPRPAPRHRALGRILRRHRRALESLHGLAERLLRSAESALGDNNALGFTLTIVLPIMVLVRRQATNPWIRGGLIAVFALSIVALFATYSRGAFIGLCLSMPLTLALSWRKDVPVLVATAAACLVIYAAPRQWVERMQTITPTAYRDDGSGSKRMKSWYVALRLGLDHPILGAGFRPFEPDVYATYMPGYWDNHDAHNHYLRSSRAFGSAALPRPGGVALPDLLHSACNPRRSGATVDQRRRALHRRSLVAIVGGVF